MLNYHRVNVDDGSCKKLDDLENDWMATAMLMGQQQLQQGNNAG